MQALHVTRVAPSGFGFEPLRLAEIEPNGDESIAISMPNSHATCRARQPWDILEAADQLGIKRFAVQGMSAGWPYALACAHALSDHVTACSLVSAVPPPSIVLFSGPIVRRFAWWAARTFPNHLRRRLQEFRPDSERSNGARASRASVSGWVARICGRCRICEAARLSLLQPYRGRV